MRAHRLTAIAKSLAPVNAISSLSVTVSVRRVTGVAPFSVHFDATGTTSSVEADSYRKVRYIWGFGETSGPGVAVWSTGAQNGATRNVAHGPIAAHLYEVPGTYTATLWAYDGQTLAGWTQIITVQDPDVVYAGKTMQYSNAGTPSSTQTITSSMDDVIAMTVTKGAGWRHRLNGGDTFSVSAVANEVTNNIRNSDLLIESYGTGNAIISFAGASLTGQSSGLCVGYSRTPTLARIIIKDITVDGSVCALTSKPWGVRHFTGSDLTVVRLVGNDVKIPYINAYTNLDSYNGDADAAKHGHTHYQGLAIWDCSITNPTSQASSSNYPYGLYGGMDYGAIQGCNFDLGTGDTNQRSHCLRVVHGFKTVIANNSLKRSGNTQHCLKLHSQTQATVEAAPAPGNVWATSVVGSSSPSAGMSDYVWIADNSLEVAYSNCPLAIGAPSNTGNDSAPHVQNVGVVGNVIYSGLNAKMQTAAWFAGHKGLFANNIFRFDTALSTQRVGVALCDREAIFSGADNAAAWQAEDVLVYNNTMYVATASTACAMMAFVSSEAVNIAVKNNALWAPNDTAPSIASGAKGATGTAITAVGYAASNNSSDVQAKQAGSPYSSATPTTLAHFVPVGGSYLLDAGAAVGLYLDLYAATRSLTTPDMGAIEV